MGLLGGFIVHPKTISTYGEFVLVLNDWQHFYTSQQHLLLVESGQFYPNSLESLTQSDTIDCFESVDGSRAAEALVTSILINGRGQYFDPRATNDNSSTTPLEILSISDSNYSTYRLRLINGGSVFSLKFSIDEHPLQVIASDGVPFTEPLIVDQLIIGLGERFDVLINRKIMNSVNYWIRVDTMDKNNNPRWYARAILQYTHESRMPTTSQKNCTVLEQCRILNCPFSQYGSEPSFICLTPQNMSTHTDYLDLDLLNETINVNVKRTLSLNMVMGNEDRAGFESINYIGMQYPSMQEPILYNAQTARYLLPCSNSRLDMNTGERCYHFILAQFGDIIEFLLVNYDTHQHPMHLHGSYFHIVEQGLAQLNTTTGEFLDNNPNVECNDYAECVCKAGSTCTKNNMRLVKDTVQVPKGGYAL
ncbi:unnamed protein product [Rotaria sp. Silwood2]|nr:unnamed protein product [Rotaria sp. Silwood2]